MRGVLMEGKPIKTSYFWDVLPKDLERIDAVTYILRKDLILYFSGGWNSGMHFNLLVSWLWVY